MSGTSPIRRSLISPRLTPSYIESLVVKEDYHHFPDTRVTVCCVTTVNDHDFVGVAICAEKRRFDLEKGKQVARNKVRQHIAEAERYLLRQRLYEYHKDTHHEPR